MHVLQTKAVRGHTARLLHLPQYFNPDRNGPRRIKAAVRKATARSIEALFDTIASHWLPSQPKEWTNFFAATCYHCLIRLTPAKAASN